MQELIFNGHAGQVDGDKLFGGSAELLDNPTTSASAEGGAPWSWDHMGPDGQVNNPGDYCGCNLTQSCQRPAQGMPEAQSGPINMKG